MMPILRSQVKLLYSYSATPIYFFTFLPYTNDSYKYLNKDKLCILIKLCCDACNARL